MKNLYKSIITDLYKISFIYKFISNYYIKDLNNKGSNMNTKITYDELELKYTKMTVRYICSNIDYVLKDRYRKKKKSKINPHESDIYNIVQNELDRQKKSNIIHDYLIINTCSHSYKNLTNLKQVCYVINFKIFPYSEYYTTESYIYLP